LSFKTDLWRSLPLLSRLVVVAPLPQGLMPSYVNHKDAAPPPNLPPVLLSPPPSIGSSFFAFFSCFSLFLSLERVIIFVSAHSPLSIYLPFEFIRALNFSRRFFAMLVFPFHELPFSGIRFSHKRHLVRLCFSPDATWSFFPRHRLFESRRHSIFRPSNC